MKRFGVLLIILLIASCQTLDSSQITSSNEEILSTPTLLPNKTETSTPLPIYTSTSTFVPTAQFTSTPDTRLTSRYWREWASVPELSQTAKNILHLAVENSDIDSHVFSKVGDCQMTSSTFLGGYANGKYPIPSGFEGTVVWFSASMTSESVTAEKGLGISSVLNPMFALSAGYSQCLRECFLSQFVANFSMRRMLAI